MRFLASLDGEFRRKFRLPCRSRYDGEILWVTLQDKRWPLFLEPKTGDRGTCYAATPSFLISIRGEVVMTDQEQTRLRAYLGLLARRDAALKSCLIPTS